MQKITQIVITIVFLFTYPIAIALDSPKLSVSTSDLTVSVFWSAVSGATGYMLYYAPHPYQGEQAVNSVDMAAKTSYSATLQDGATYYVAVKAYNNTTMSEYSNIELFTIAMALNAPVLTTSISDLDVSLSWTAISGATGYMLYYAPHPYQGEQTINNLDIAANTTFSTTLANDAAYHVAVKAYNNNTMSDYSNIELLSIEASADVPPSTCPDFSGVWTLMVSNITSSCGPESGWSSTVNITQNGCSVQTTGIKNTSFNVNGSIEGNTLTIGPGGFPEDGGTTNSTFTLTPTTTSDTTLTGTETWFWNGGGSSCVNGTADVSATKN